MSERNRKLLEQGDVETFLVGLVPQKRVLENSSHGNEVMLRVGYSVLSMAMIAMALAFKVIQLSDNYSPFTHM